MIRDTDEISLFGEHWKIIIPLLLAGLLVSAWITTLLVETPFWKVFAIYLGCFIIYEIACAVWRFFERARP